MQNRIDVIHGLGAAVILGAAGSSIANKEYTAASYFLTSNGYDAVGSSGASDFWDSYWTGFDTNLGTPTSNRYVWNGLICRNFSGGMVLVNPPGSSTQSVFLPGIYLRTDGTQVNVLSLAPKHGAILIFAGTPPVSPRLPAGYAIDSSK
ncbi:MAG: hypothetical protein JO211_08205 [Acidobacteriaceae bacterium]|nr:hypothetical protein [Acidobacteriaceae bacterium]